MGFEVPADIRRAGKANRGHTAWLQSGQRRVMLCRGERCPMTTVSPGRSVGTILPAHTPWNTAVSVALRWRQCGGAAVEPDGGNHRGGLPASSGRAGVEAFPGAGPSPQPSQIRFSPPIHPGRSRAGSQRACSRCQRRRARWCQGRSCFAGAERSSFYMSAPSRTKTYLNARQSAAPDPAAARSSLRVQIGLSGG